MVDFVKPLESEFERLSLFDSLVPTVFPVDLDYPSELPLCSVFLANGVI